MDAAHRQRRSAPRTNARSVRPQEAIDDLLLDGRKFDHFHDDLTGSPQIDGRDGFVLLYGFLNLHLERAGLEAPIGKDHVHFDFALMLGNSKGRPRNGLSRRAIDGHLVLCRRLEPNDARRGRREHMAIRRLIRCRDELERIVGFLRERDALQMRCGLCLAATGHPQ